MKEGFLQKVDNGTVCVAVVGLGYVGLPLAEAYIAKGIKVIGYDISQNRVDMLNNNISGMDHIADDRIAKINSSGIFNATTDANKLVEADAILICVPTPLDNYHHPDLSYVISTCETLQTILRPGQLVVLESTTYPGTTEDVLRPILEKSGLKVGQDFALAYSPEREDPGNATYETSTIPKLVGADSTDETEIAVGVYSLIVETISVSSSRVAEAAKLVENIFRWVNIGLANELKLIFDAMGIDVWEVVKAADSKPFGFMAFYPGPGVGGHCIRIDPYYLTWKAREHGLATRFVELAGEVNIAMPEHVVNRTMIELNGRFGKSLKGSKILLCGMAYKRNISDFRESPSLEIYQILRSRGADVDYYDPHVPIMENVHGFEELDGKQSIVFSEESLKQYSCAIISTDHSNVNYETLGEIVPLIVDTRNIMNECSEAVKEKVAKA